MRLADGVARVGKQPVREMLAQTLLAGEHDVVLEHHGIDGAPTFEAALAALPAGAPALLFGRTGARRGLGEDGHAPCTGAASLNDALRARA